MHATVIHKKGAGDGEHSEKKLRKLFDEHEIEINYLRSGDDWELDVLDGSDLVVVAGGDGTVAKVARRLVGTKVPFAILPLGTANNVANALGWTGKASDVVEALASARRIRFDVAVARGPWGTERCIEGVGLGAFPQAMAFIKRHADWLLPDPDDDRDAVLTRDLQVAGAFLAEARAERWQLELDGEQIEGAFLLLEVMNTGSIGPNIELAPGADVTDGMLDVVMVGEPDREALLDYLERLKDGPTPPPPLPTRTARNVRIGVESARLHVDDDVWPKAKKPPPPLGAPFEVDIRLSKQPLLALAPSAG